MTGGIPAGRDARGPWTGSSPAADVPIQTTVTSLAVEGRKLAEELVERLWAISDRMLGPVPRGEPESPMNPMRETATLDMVQIIVLRLKAAHHVVDGLSERL